MRYPLYSNDEFVNAQIFDTGTTQIVQGIESLSSGQIFFIPGVVSPSALLFSFNSNLTVNVNAPLPFKCLFVSGAFTDAHGTVNGTDTTVYLVDFSSLVPGSGTVTAYIVAQLTTVNEDPYVVVGPPVGHPDYSASFVPYLAYATTQESLAITTTTTAPDNLNFIELARITLSAGQTIITTVDTTHQVLARLNVSESLNGDVTGPLASNVISRLQGTTVSAASPPANSALIFNGSAWVASPYATLSINMAGDVIGTTNANIATKSSFPTFTTNNISANGNIALTGNLLANGFLQGANAGALNQAIMLGQLTGFLQQNGYVQLPVNDLSSSSIINLIVQWGFTPWGSTSHPETTYSTSWNITFPHQCLWATGSIVYDPGSTGFDWGLGLASNGASTTLNISPSGGTFYLNFFGGGTAGGYFPGWVWIAVGF